MRAKTKEGNAKKGTVGEGHDLSTQIVLLLEETVSVEAFSGGVWEWKK